MALAEDATENLSKILIFAGIVSDGEVLKRYCARVLSLAETVPKSLADRALLGVGAFVLWAAPRSKH